MRVWMEHMDSFAPVVMIADRLDARSHAFDHARREGGPDERAQPRVLRRVRVQHPQRLEPTEGPHLVGNRRERLGHRLIRQRPMR